MRRLHTLLALAVSAFLLAACPSAPQAPTAATGKPYTVAFNSPQEVMAYLRKAYDGKGLISAHRGGPMPGYPENAIETFEHSLLYAPCLIECDVQQSADGKLFMLHDDQLERTTTGTGLAKALSLQQLQTYTLKDRQQQATPYHIPTLRDVLAWSKDKALLTVDPKRGTPLKQIVAEIQEAKAQNRAILITYTLPQALEALSLDPTLLVSASMRSLEDIARFDAAGADFSRIVAFIGTSEPDAATYAALKARNVPTILGVMGNLDRSAEARGVAIYEQLHRNGACVLSSDRVAAAAEGLGWAPQN